jgi:hypothetical protein
MDIDKIALNNLLELPILKLCQIEYKTVITGANRNRILRNDSRLFDFEVPMGAVQSEA